MKVYRLSRPIMGTKVFPKSEGIRGLQMEKRLADTEPSPALADVTLPEGSLFKIVQEEHEWYEPKSDVKYPGKYCTIEDESGRYYNVPSDALRNALLDSD